jgi:hypothetical protein
MAINSIPNLPEVSRSPFEQHFTPEQLGEWWGLSADSIRRLFEHESGVLIVQRAGKKSRGYRTLRIPESVALRVHRRLTNPLVMPNR